MHNHKHPYQLAIGGVLLLLAVPLIWCNPQPSYLPTIAPSQLVRWNVALELFAVVVAMLISVTGYSAILSARKGAVVWLGVAFFGVGLLDALHLMSFVGTTAGVAADPARPAGLFWLASRLLAAPAMLLYALLPILPEVDKVRRRMALMMMLVGVCVLGYPGLFWPDRLPNLLAEAAGSATVRAGLQWLIVCVNLVTLGVLWRRREVLVHECVMALGLAASMSGASALLSMGWGTADTDSGHVMGSGYKLLAYLYLFHATFNEALRRPLQRMTTQNWREKVTLNAAPDGVLWVDDTGQILMANPSMEALTGYRPTELVGQNVGIFLPEHLRARHTQSMRDYFTAPHSRAMGLMDLKLARRDGQMLPVDISLGHWDDEGARYAIAYVRDLTERKRFEESLRHQATHDELTGLPNRWLFHLQLNQSLARAARSGRRVAVLLLDLDYFKTVNDSFGHAMGDALLVQVGARIRGALRENDLLARLGGDEFAVLVTDLDELDEVVSVATKLLMSLQASYRLQDQDVYSGASLGLAFYPDDARDSETLLRYADMAMYQAKQAGRGAYAFYSPELDRRVHEDMRLHTHLKDAIALGAMSLHYQPQVDVQTGLIVGAEALLRWHDPELGHVSPARFIPVAEATGLILPLSDWVLETACLQIAAWERAGTPIRVAVNVSAQQFRQRNLPEKVHAALARTGALSQWLDIEITESAAMTQPEHAREQLDALVALGCRVALDDFGTGYSSLGYLKALPVSKLKIDKSFMQGIPGDSNDVSISRAIIALAHSLGLTLVAEGVETDAQLAFLRQNGCEVYQGWLFAKAMAAEDLTERLRRIAPSATRAIKR